MRYQGKALLAALVSVSMVASSTAAGAATASAPQISQPNAWMTLSMLSPTGATALGGTSVAAAQADTPLPPPPRTTEPPETTLLLIGSTLVLAALLAIALSHHGHNASPD